MMTEIEGKPAPLISVITVTWNAESLLEQTILSVIKQTYKNVEYIIIDGGSTDGTRDIIKKYENYIAYWESERDGGVYDAMNKALAKATGDWFYFIGAGDLLIDVLDKIAPGFTNNNRIYYGSVYKLDELKVYDGFFPSYKLAVKNICHQAIFYPKVVFKKYAYNLKYKIQADYDLNMRCYGDSDFSFEHIPVMISIYEGTGTSANNLDYTFYQDKLEIVKTNLGIFVYLYSALRNRFAKMLGRNYSQPLGNE